MCHTAIFGNSNETVTSSNDLSNRPWAKTKRYGRLQKIKNEAKKRYGRNPSELNKALLKQCVINQHLLYDELKHKYYRKLIISIGDDARKFYQVMRSKKRPKNTLPISMIYKGPYVMANNVWSSCVNI